VSTYNFSMPPLSDQVNPPDQIERLDNFRALYGFVEITSPRQNGFGAWQAAWYKDGEREVVSRVWLRYLLAELREYFPAFEPERREPAE
jgi:hypothetical protein